MPARVVRGEINASDSLARVSMGADLTFRSLIVAVDDFGRIDGRLPALKAALFPMREEVTLKKLDGWLDELSAGSDAPVIRYIVDGRPYLALTGWEKHRGKGRRGESSKCPEPLPRKSEEVHITSEEMHADPPESREARDEKREAGSEKRETRAPADRGRGSVCPDDLSDHDVGLAQAWGRERGFTDAQLDYGWQRVRAWARSKSIRRADWLSTLQNAMSDGWALKGYGANHGAEPESPAQARARRTKEAAQRVVSRLSTTPKPFALLAGGGEGAA